MQTPGVTRSKNGAASLAGDRQISRLHPHQHLYLEGDPALSVFEVVSGIVTVYRLLPDGRRQVHCFASKGDVLALDFADHYRHSAEAITEAEVRSVPREHLYRKLRDDPTFGRDIFRRMADMLQASREQALLIGRKNALERTASFLLFLNQKSPARARGTYIIIRMSRCDIADYLGLTFETVSRMLHRLKKIGVIDLPKADRFRILNGDLLRQLAGSSNDFQEADGLARTG